ncbi:hypothetical protein [Paenibacillus sp. YN15]|uniref:hypothetical protein n=1 Tax=Paenibacillus sp. YN15 TaxID=1742774 RepID=UPI001C662075|nr:hypothetical protein [Paenibacillus sp. YN15]
MAKIMKAKMPHTIFFQDKGKVLCDEVRFNSIAHCIHIEIVQVVCAVRILAKAAGLNPLLLLKMQQQVIEGVYEL